MLLQELRQEYNLKARLLLLLQPLSDRSGRLVESRLALNHNQMPELCLDLWLLGLEQLYPISDKIKVFSACSPFLLAVSFKE